MSNGKYVLVQKTISKVTDETKYEELLVSDDIMDILNRLMGELKMDHAHYCSIEMSDAKSFVSETFDRTYIYSIHFKKDQEVMRFKEEEGSSTHCETCKNYESMSDITGWCSACPGTVIKDMNTNNTCAAYEKREEAK